MNGEVAKFYSRRESCCVNWMHDWRNVFREKATVIEFSSNLLEKLGGN